MSLSDIFRACREAYRLRNEAQEDLARLGSELASGSRTLDEDERRELSELMAEYESAFVASYSSLPSPDDVVGPECLDSQELGQLLLSLAAEWEAERND